MSKSIVVKENYPLSSLTTFKLGGECKGVYFCQTELQIREVLGEMKNKNSDFIVIGEGSNILVADDGIDCFVIRYVSEEPAIDWQGYDIVVSGSTNLDEVALFAAERGLNGINFLSGIPGTVGGAVYGNAGAFGQAIGDAIYEIEIIDKNGNKKKIPKDEMQLGYRHSILKETKDIVASVRLKLLPGDSERLLIRREEILDVRREKHPDWRSVRCAGSFFKNTDKFDDEGKRVAAGKLLDEVGAKSMSVGGASVFEKHANMIIANDGCKSSDIFSLSKKMADAVKHEFDITLNPEVQLIGQFE